MDKNQLINEIAKSKDTLKNHIKENKLSKEKVVHLVHNVLEGEATETQKIINMHYIDECNMYEISEIVGISEIEVLYHFQLILYKIKLILGTKDKEQGPYSASKFTGQTLNKDSNEKIGSLLDKKS